MKRMWTITIMIALTVCGTIVLNQTQADPDGAATRPSAAPTRIAICDVAQILVQFRQARDLAEKFQKRSDAFNTEGLRRTKVIREAGEMLDTMKEGTEDFEKLLRETQEMDIRLRVWTETQKLEINRGRYVHTRKMYNQIKEMVATVARQRNIDVVLYRRHNRIAGPTLTDLLDRIDRQKVIYNAKHVDITDTVLKQLDDAYKKKKQ